MTQPAVRHIATALSAQSQATLTAWHAMLESGNMDALDDLFAEALAGEIVTTTKEHRG